MCVFTMMDLLEEARFDEFSRYVRGEAIEMTLRHGFVGVINRVGDQTIAQGREMEARW